MPEFRQNMATKEWVIISPERARRPEDFAKDRPKKARSLPAHKKSCPFCPGNESKTPEAVLEIPGNSKWALRVVPNKFAALKDHLTPERIRVGKFLKAGGFGIGEVVIETPAHNKTIATLEPKEVEAILKAYRTRYLEIAKNEKITLITIFRNHGVRAGTSLEHPHSQIIATPIVPPHVRDQIFQARVSCDTYGGCIYCAMIKEELSQGERIVAETDHFVAFCPYASRSPFETRILPKRHASVYGAITDVEIKDLANLLRKILKKIRAGLNDPDYNYVIRSAPTEDIHASHYHWYIVIIPRITTAAGFEIGSGIYINTSYPESCAQFLGDLEAE